ncbi:MAG: hypothetical protein HOD92_22560 [Deltaproteobacteria bacterium]|nr:hypothetical protein [Deltaproteobacteria bacterium]MBT4525728.1 hypothetical protein [Deltaproteobacteria bacterium]
MTPDKTNIERINFKISLLTGEIDVTGVGESKNSKTVFLSRRSLSRADSPPGNHLQNTKMMLLPNYIQVLR